MTDSYLTIETPGEGIYKEKMSKFMAFAFAVDSAAEAKAAVSGYQKKYFDARHVCWAYMIGRERTDFMSNDNGEPSGTAGKPILGQINSFGLTNVCVVVVRYFGGIKLGTSGLIAAYREAAKEALSNAVIVERHEMTDISFTFPYLAMNDVMRLAKTDGVKIVGQQFDNSCAMTLRVRAGIKEYMIESLTDIDGVTL